MKTEAAQPESCRLMVIGAGMAGMAAALFAARRGVATIQAGLTGETIYASGLFDLYGVSHDEPRQLIDDPWRALQALKASHPQHPYCHLEEPQIRQAMDLLCDFLGDAGLAYHGRPDRNVRLITPVGTIKRTYRVPATMWAGVQALEAKAPSLIVDLQGLRGFSARQIADTLGPAWPELRAATIEVSWENRLGPKYAELLARGLEVEQARRELADAIRPHLDGVSFVGLPAMLGIHRTGRVHHDLESRLGVKVFEIPTMPPAVSGIRLKEALDVIMARLGVKTYYNHSVHAVARRPDGRFELQVGRTEAEIRVIADQVLLATGRFLGKGLAARRDGIRETLLDLPVCQPPDRSLWHREELFDPRGHAINLAGIEVDHRFRPLNGRGRVAYKNLYAAGSILAHQDWIRTKSGTGLAVATAYGAVQALADAPAGA